MTTVFRSPSDQPLHVALTSGHTALVTPEGNELAQMFQREAIARGAVLVEGGNPEARIQTQHRSATVREAVQAMIAGQDKDDFTGDGRINLMRLKSKAGFQVTREEADAIWAELTGAQGD